MEAVAPLPELALIEPPIQSAAPVFPRAESSDVMSPAKGKRRQESLFVHALLLLSITAIGGVLRFVWLDRPSIWGDEAATFGRACGTFPELMGRLQSAGFAPVHYELLWWIGQHALLTPFMMRLVPAIAGTLMIPAMYWLAAQLIGRRAALLTALLTATNAFLLNYSRDAKMYSPFWFFCAVNVAALLWWLRVRTPLSWCVWLASGTAMVGFDALGWITVAVELLIVLTTRKSNWLSVVRLAVLLFFASAIWCLTLGPAVLAVLLAGHYFDGPFKRTAIALIALAILRVLWLTIGYWMSRRHAHQEESDEPEPGTLKSKAGSERLTRIFRWPTERSVARPWFARRVAAFRWPPIVLFIFGVLIMFAGPFGYYYDFNRFLEKVDENGWHGTGIDWVQGYDAGRSGPSLVGFTASAFLTSWEWPRPVDEPAIAPRTLRLLTAGTLSIATVLALGLLPIPWSRKLHPSFGIGGWRSALWLTIWLTLPPYAFYCVSIKDHAGPFPWITTPARPDIADLHKTILDFFATIGNAAALLVQQLQELIHSSPPMAVAMGLVALAWVWMAGSNWKERFLRVLGFLSIICIAVLAIEIVYLIYPLIDEAFSKNSQAWRQHGSVWMPRYVAVILPAVLIVASALLFRLPTRPLRWGAVLLVVGVNLAVHGARVLAGSEQPSALIARDILNSEPSAAGNSFFRAYFQPAMQSFGAEPGSTGLYSSAMRYYITIFSPRTTPINEVIASQMHYRVYPGRSMWMSFTGNVINDVRRLPRLTTFVTWERLEPQEIDLTDKPLDALSPDWRLASEESFAVRDHWRWKDTCVLRRRVYVRAGSSR